MNNGKLVVPQSLVNTYLKRLLGMHQGGPKMLARARQTLWWPHRAPDIGNIAKTCLPCEESKPSNPEEVILSHKPALYPFQYCHMDIGQGAGRYYLITTDQFSGYPNIHELGKTCKVGQVIDATAHFVSLFSIPEKIYSDGGPQFLKDGEFDTWCKDWGIKLVRSSPYMPRSNGVAEAAVKEMKKLIRANLTTSANIDTQSLLAGLIMFRNTPRNPTNKSPAELLFGRQIRDSLPCPRDMLLPQYRYHSEERLYNHEIARQKGPSRELPLLNPRASVRIQNPITKKWDNTGEVLDFGLNRREYLIRTGDKIIRRNRHFLKEYEAEATPAWKQPVQAPHHPNVDQQSEDKQPLENLTPPVVYTTPPPTPSGVTTRWSTPVSRLTNAAGSVSTTTTSANRSKKSFKTPTSVRFGSTVFKSFNEDDPIAIPRDVTPAKSPILKTKTVITPLTKPNNIPIDLSLKHKRQLPQELSLLQLALLSRQCPNIDQDYYRLELANSCSLTQVSVSSPLPTAALPLPPTTPRPSQLIRPDITPYRHPNVGTAVTQPKTNFDSIAARYERLQKLKQPVAQLQSPIPPAPNPWLSTSASSKLWNNPARPSSQPKTKMANSFHINNCINIPPRNYGCQ
jgi:hypothetical protein